MEKVKTGGLAGIVAGDSAICMCGAEEESLLYRGYRIEDLAAHASFEEVAWLLTRGELPTQKELAAYQDKLIARRDLPQILKKILEELPPSTNMMDLMRTGCSVLGNLEPETKSNTAIDIADRLIACFSSILLYWYQFHKTGKSIDLNTKDRTLAGHILHLLTGKSPSESHRRCLDVSLILYAEHEFNASTFTVRTITSTLSDFYSAICGGIGALRGSLHGGANEAAWDLIKKFNSAPQAEKAILEMLQKKELIMGFGHRVYTTSDPRSAIMKPWAEQLSDEAGSPQTFEVAEQIEKVMWREKKLFPNADFYSALSYHFCGFPTPMFTPLFVMSRITGWSSHLMEQRSNNKLIRPVSNYTGPQAKKWIPIEAR
jgi:2-methylcitrate synthase